jgi:hypothetical protein
MQGRPRSPGVWDSRRAASGASRTAPSASTAGAAVGTGSINTNDDRLWRQWPRLRAPQRRKEMASASWTEWHPRLELKRSFAKLCSAEKRRKPRAARR